MALLHAIGWGVLLLVVTPSRPGLLGTGVLAYSLGLRHAFDADHIAAIDNTTRAFLEEGRRQVGVGFFFSLGHSTVVAAMALALAVATGVAQAELPMLRDIGGLFGTVVSGGFLYVIGIVNLIVLVDLVRAFRRTRAADDADDDSLDAHLGDRGLLNRFVSRFYERIDRSWQLYPLGVLFGLGFDTASEIALLAVAAGAASSGVSVTGILVLPVLFAAGMCALDTADGAFMAYAYDWAFTTPTRKLYYNVTVTAISVVVALFVGTVELAQVLASTLDLHGAVWTALRTLSLGALGYAVVALFAVAWALSYGVWKLGGFDDGTADAT
ncbi:HoxN/HupN/NixA family nickel/cobalt transporter [Halarchaeum acidiphilum]|uniref:HoxN/HupN/NixA family nickel/cobalt transporter n=1 Tax=Halarchaeum acidiphilum TaxID=489138 RepID=UPI001900AB46|nr:HoxN/HupN/NixA family nickel/cobalt transporter [Halarchaeum acidiphilum]